MRRSVARLLPVMLLALAACTGGGGDEPTALPPSSLSSGAAPRCPGVGTPCPTIAPARVLSSVEHHGGNFNFRPPEVSMDAAIPVDQALAAAAERRPLASAASIQPILALYQPSHGNSQAEELVWVIEFLGGPCIIPPGPPRSPSCEHQTWRVVIDAADGNFLFSFTD